MTQNPVKTRLCGARREGERSRIEVEQLDRRPRMRMQPFCLVAAMLPWECISLGDLESQPDLDDLVRMLEEL